MLTKLFVRFIVFISIVYLSLNKTLAQKNDSTYTCKVLDLKTLALTTNDEQIRVKLTEEWLAKYVRYCAIDQLVVMKNNLPAWLGTANTTQISRTVDSLYLKMMASTNSKPNSEDKTPSSPSISSRTAIDSVSTNKNVPIQSLVNKTTASTASSSTTTETNPSAPSSLTSPSSQPKPTSREYALRKEEISQCLSNDIQTWGDGEKDTKMLSQKMVFVYQHLGAPKPVLEQSMLTLLRTAASSWDQCGGTNLVVLDKDYVTTTPGLKITVDWNDKETVGTIGIANITKRKLTFNPEIVQKIIQINESKNLNESYLLETLQMTASHEIGHFQGLSSHSKRCVDVLSYYSVGGEKCTTRNGGSMPLGFYEYRSSLPTSCDIERCRIANKNSNLTP